MMIEPWQSQVPYAVVKGVMKAQKDITRACRGLLQLCKTKPSMHYRILATCIQKEITNGDMPKSKRDIIDEIDTLL